MNTKYQQIVNRMTDRLHLGRIPVRQNYKIADAQALRMANGQRYIEYNPMFISNLASYSYWAILMVFAHEVAHHYNDDREGSFTGVDHQARQQELNADWFAGWMLRCEGARLDQATDVYEAYEFKANRTHPGEATRINALVEGWKSANCRINPPKNVVRSSMQIDPGLGKALVGVTATILVVIGITAIVRSI